MKFEKKIFAKEWIILILSVLFGLLILPVIINLFIADEHTFSKIYKRFFIAIFDREEGVYLFILLPYFFVQFVRSIVWSIKAMKKSNS